MAVRDALKAFPTPWRIGTSDTRLPIKAANRRTVAYVQLAVGDGDVAKMLVCVPELIEAAKELLAARDASHALADDAAFEARYAAAERSDRAAGRLRVILIAAEA